ncbi:NUDIX domain-containing protein [Akkermansiaceae bacterium]|nr:NUDIX domain-containing protein [Akkermansiaceae bacterium]
MTRFFSWALHKYFLLSRGLTIGVRAVVRSKDGGFLLVRHSYTPGWHFPGGGVEPGESVIKALERELREETGLVLKGEIGFHGVYHNCEASRKDHVLVYCCEVEEKDAPPASNLEIRELGYFGPDELPGGIDPGTKQRIQEIVNHLVPSKNW